MRSARIAAVLFAMLVLLAALAREIDRQSRKAAREHVARQAVTAQR